MHFNKKTPASRSGGYLLSATAGGTVTVAVKDYDYKENQPYVAVIKNVAEASHVYVLPFCYLERRLTAQLK